MAARFGAKILSVTALAYVAVTLQGCGDDNNDSGDVESSDATATTTTTKTVASGACVTMTDTDPCYVACSRGGGCTDAICTALGTMGCDGAQCELMGTGDNAHCMSPMMTMMPEATTTIGECVTMTATDPCYVACPRGDGCTDTICADLGTIGCDGSQCELMGTGDNAHCMSPMTMMAEATTTTTAAACESMTETDPCYVACGRGDYCTEQDCTDLGEIGCDGANCTLMGADANAHCMSPMAMI
mmetsp:Transcript_450/g.1048  ORF Transcript_450/g.1048 Transcript_450/m.1048 type:complete len:244 (-) Transcript_450:108-839(-)|eukprot:CAMPEP_0206480444 /NCGR_PEP_ID=MMETSP0324_2-20121206/37333_1 /ASSEMBLY_ACC=CAM_ASM_000836 /TAXON_ID=2866 /ORGANISM="Crypthecodinium cohnii, Strain Seligo" /LENGTH=243 /DNA_ID=CAMNT_0053957303 /DNA_START=96 /DNA_END=827 /DNA_ORIENTATION=-